MTTQRSDSWGMFLGGILGVLVACGLVLAVYLPQVKPKPGRMFRSVGIGADGVEQGVPVPMADESRPVLILMRE